MTRLLLILSFLLFLPADVSAADNAKKDQEPNRLLKEASPYLRQHAYNPIDWYPWGDEAFKKARKQQKPIFLSVGYSTCHWCHVMARESFVDKEVAEFLNKYFVSIKVDRERLPDIDETYMIATELIARQGGWPNSVFLSPDLKPFHASTYMPKDIFLQTLKSVATGWEKENVAIIEQGNQIAALIEKVMTRRVKTSELTPEKLSAASRKLLTNLDVFHGGFSEAPKFPQENLLLFLAERALHRDDKEAAKALQLTLENILDGGIHDHLGGGFHRYTVDNEWRVPHFEKMLYNQALLSLVLIRAHKLAAVPRYESALRHTLDFVLKEMTGPEGGFYSAFDAESDGHEGTYYVWTPKSLMEALGDKDASLAAKLYGVTATGNFERETTILHYPNSLAELAKNLGLPEKELHRQAEAIKQKLSSARQKRTRPNRDDKYIVSWNALMISAFAEAAEHLGDENYAKAAGRAAEFIWSNMRSSNEGLKRIFFEGKAALGGSQEDYAFLANAFLSLYDLTGDRQWLIRAETLADEMVEKFQDEEAGDFYRTADQATFTRGKTRNDSSIPSGNASALELFARLARRSTDPKHRERAEAVLNSLSGIAVQSPFGNAYALKAADSFLHGRTGPKQYFAKGTVRATASHNKNANEIKLNLDIAPGWHINANKVLEDFLIPTQVKLAGNADAASANYPAPIVRKLGFHDKDLALYEGRIEITLPIKQVQKVEKIKTEITLQACSEQICLEPETAILTNRVVN